MSDYQPHDTQPLTSPETESIETPEPQRGGCGCWIAGVTTVIVFTVLVGIGLFLPPINLYQRFFGLPYATLTASANAVAKEGLTVAAPKLVSGQTVGVTVGSVAMTRFLAGDASAGTWIPNAL